MVADPAAVGRPAMFTVSALVTAKALAAVMVGVPKDIKRWVVMAPVMVSVWAATLKSLFSAVMAVWAPGVNARVGIPPLVAELVRSRSAAGEVEPMPTLPVDPMVMRVEREFKEEPDEPPAAVVWKTIEPPAPVPVPFPPAS